MSSHSTFSFAGPCRPFHCPSLPFIGLRSESGAKEHSSGGRHSPWHPPMCNRFSSAHAARFLIQALTGISPQMKPAAPELYAVGATRRYVFIAHSSSLLPALIPATLPKHLRLLILSCLDSLQCSTQAHVTQVLQPSLSLGPVPTPPTNPTCSFQVSGTVPASPKLQGCERDSFNLQAYL